MITKKTIGDHTFELRDKDDITWGAQRRVERFIDSHVLAMMKGAKSEDKEQIFDTMLSHPDEFADYLQLTGNEDEVNQIGAVMLVTNLEFPELEELSISTMKSLRIEVEKIVGNVSDFLTGLGINIESKLMTVDSDSLNATKEG